MLLLTVRTIILYFLILFFMKIMGKRQLGQLQPFELVVVLIFSELASSAMQNSGIPILNSIIPIAVIAVVQIIMAVLNLKHEKMRDFICGKPSIVISRGKIIESEMRHLRMNINDLQEQLRPYGYFDISDIEFAVMETNGKLSVMPKTGKRPLQTDDLALDLKQEQPAELVILDGNVNHHSLQVIGKNEAWLKKELKKYKLDNIKDIFYASIDDQGEMTYQLKNCAINTKNNRGEGHD